MRKHHGDPAVLAELHTGGCRGKLRHPSKAHAASAARLILSEGEHYAQRVLIAYKCRVCGSWHVGNTARHQVRDASSIIASPLERALADALWPYLHAE